MICVDASVAAKWVLDEKDSDKALSLYIEMTRDSRPIVAPQLLPIEITNILRKRLRTVEGFTIEEAVTLLERFLRLPIEIQNPEGLQRRALVLADAFGLPAIYDAHYLSLAESLGCSLWTDDRRLYLAVAGRLPFVKLLSDYEPRS